MAEQIKEDLTKNDYDPTFQGVDIETAFSQAAEQITSAASVGEASAVLAEVLLRLDDSHTKFYPPERLTRVACGQAVTMTPEQAGQFYR